MADKQIRDLQSEISSFPPNQLKQMQTPANFQNLRDKLLSLKDQQCFYKAQRQKYINKDENSDNIDLAEIASNLKMTDKTS